MEIIKKIVFGILAVTFLFLGAVESKGASARGMSPQEIVMNA
jgi:hypothetical protein